MIDKLKSKVSTKHLGKAISLDCNQKVKLPLKWNNFSVIIKPVSFFSGHSLVLVQVEDVIMPSLAIRGNSILCQNVQLFRQEAIKALKDHF